MASRQWCTWPRRAARIRARGGRGSGQRATHVVCRGTSLIPTRKGGHVRKPYHEEHVCVNDETCGGGRPSLFGAARWLFDDEGPRLQVLGIASGCTACCSRSMPVWPPIQEEDGDLGLPLWLAGRPDKALPGGPCARGHFEWLGQLCPQPGHEQGLVGVPIEAVRGVAGHHAQEPWGLRGEPVVAVGWPPGALQGLWLLYTKSSSLASCALPCVAVHQVPLCRMLFAVCWDKG